MLRLSLRWVWRYGLIVLLGSFIAYKLAFTWIPIWARASELEGMQVSHLTMEDESGRRIALGDFRGEPLILNFWATWCVPCRIEIPLLAHAYPDLKAQGKQLVGVNLQESWQAINRFREDVSMPYPVYRDNGKLAEALGIGLLPAIVVINGEGRVQTIMYGFRPWVKWYLEWWI
ncbi:MAG: TlpA disulfide reductase family protein [SAR324 cluster bacterium]|nr:TlpA disulfide reductase family protein [SAR324 cluster bacterium]